MYDTGCSCLDLKAADYAAPSMMRTSSVSLTCRSVQLTPIHVVIPSYAVTVSNFRNTHGWRMVSFLRTASGAVYEMPITKDTILFVDDTTDIQVYPQTREEVEISYQVEKRGLRGAL